MAVSWRKGWKNPDQIPMFVPDSDWVAPTELPYIPDGEIVAIDTETRDEGLNKDIGPGWYNKNGHLCGVSYAYAGGAGYIPIRHPDTPECFDEELVIAWLIDLDQRCTLIFQNASYDLGWTGLEPSKPVHDTHAMAVMLDENRLSYSLDALCKWHDVPGKDESKLREAADIYSLNPKTQLWRLPAKYVGPYATQDAISTLGVYSRMAPMLIGQKLDDAYETERKLIPYIIKMRRNGMPVNVDRAEQLRDRYRKMVLDTLGEIKKLTNSRRAVDMGDIRSPIWLETTFHEMQIEYPRTETGRPSFEKDFLARHEHALPRAITKARGLNEAAEKFIGNYILGYVDRGRLHAEINQLRDADEENGSKGTRSYRFSYSNPPLQQMNRPDPDKATPGHKDFIEGFVDIGTEIRGCFEPEPGEVIGAPDYSQQEYRMIVHYAYALDLPKSDIAREKYHADPNTDFHNFVVELTGLTRKRAKDCNFAKAFGAGVPKFALMTGMSVDEAGQTMEQYDTELPFVKMLAEECRKMADKRGYVRLIDGRRARFDMWEPTWMDKDDWARGRLAGQDMFACDIKIAQARCHNPLHVWFKKRLRRAFTHKAGNRVIQGSAAVQTKEAMLMQAENGYLPLLQMHDELVHSVPNKRYAKDIVDIMVEVRKLHVPVKVDAEFGLTWGTSKYSYEEAVKKMRSKK